ncbi:MAG TPA: acido-empty-quinoprotein group A [Steroidobacteraceae bacterium]|nr:acido-empty-quinoprotein group A [Steroidobacteraceae bacterium]
MTAPAVTAAARAARAVAVAAAAVAAAATTSAATPTLPPSRLLQPLAQEWPTYSGDYTGRRYSSLRQIDRSTVRQLTLAWTVRMNGAVRRGGGGIFGGSGPAVVTVEGGEGSGEFSIGAPNVKGDVLQVGGILYVTSVDNVWALDGRDGHELWHYFWKTRGGTHIANRGAAIWNDSLFFETPDDYLVSLDVRNGHENWHVMISDLAQEYFSTMAPVVIGDHVLAGTGNDSDAPGFLQSFDPATGRLQWKHYTVPMKAGDPALKTWPSLDAARHGGGQVWMPGAYDPETGYYIFGTGNPTPGYTGIARKGDNLYTCTLMAVKVQTGEMVWYYQTSPHDTHDWDSAQTPVLIDGVIDGRPRKLVATAARNGYFFTLDRVTGEHIATGRFGTTINWSRGLTPDGHPIPDPAKEATVPGSLVSPFEGGVTNWQANAFNPGTGLFYTHEGVGFNILYLTDPDPRGSMGLGGKRFTIVSFTDAFEAIDYRTGRTVWRHTWPGGGGVGSGVLTTATGLVFTGDGNGNFLAMDATDGTPLWHTRIGNITNAPETYVIDGRQYLLAAVGDTLYAFVLY